MECPREENPNSEVLEREKRAEGIAMGLRIKLCCISEVKGKSLIKSRYSGQVMYSRTRC